MRVLHCIEEYLPPSQIWLYRQLTGLPDVQHLIATERLLPNNFYHPDFKIAVGKLGEFRAQALNTARHDLAGRIRRWKNWPAEQWLNDRGKWMVDFARREKADLVHAHFGNHALRLVKVLQKTELPLVVSFYGHDYGAARAAAGLPKIPVPAESAKSGSHAYQQLFALADCFISEGPYGQRQLIQLGCPPEKTKVVPFGVDWPEATVEPTTPTKVAGSLRLVQVAHFTPKKGQLDVVEALAKVRATKREVTLTFIGSPRAEGYLEQVKARVADLQLQNWVRFIPAMPYAALARELQAHHVFIHPSQWTPSGDCEGGAPVILLTAQAMGLPVIATQHCDIPFLVTDQTTGSLVPERDTEALATTISYWADLTSAQLQAFASAARSHVRKAFSNEKSSDTLRRVYQEILEAH